MPLVVFRRTASYLDTLCPAVNSISYEELKVWIWILTSPLAGSLSVGNLFSLVESQFHPLVKQKQFYCKIQGLLQERKEMWEDTFHSAAQYCCPLAVSLAIAIVVLEKHQRWHCHQGVDIQINGRRGLGKMSPCLNQQYETFKAASGS